jgi:hypothetical protein
MLGRVAAAEDADTAVRVIGEEVRDDPHSSLQYRQPDGMSLCGITRQRFVILRGVTIASLTNIGHLVVSTRMSGV